MRNLGLYRSRASRIGRIITLIFALGICAFNSAPAHAIGLPNIGKLLVGQALDEIDAKLSQMEAAAESGINMEEVSAYETLMNTSAELRNKLQDSLNENIDNLNRAKTQALRDLYEQVNQIGQDVNGTIYTAEIATNNVRYDLPFKQMPFIILDQEPAIFKTVADGQITLRGNGIGISDSSHDYAMQATTRGTSLDVVPYPNRVVISVPGDVLKKTQKDSGLAYLPVDIDASVTQSCRLGLSHCTTHHKLRLSVAIAPRYLASAVFEAYAKKDFQGDAVPTDPLVVETPEMDGVKACVHHDWPPQYVDANKLMVVSAGPAKPNGCSPMRECLLSLYSTCKLIGDTGYQCSSCDEGPKHQMIYQAVIVERVPGGVLLTSQAEKLSASVNTFITFPTNAAEVSVRGMSWDEQAFEYRVYPVNETPATVPISCGAPKPVAAGQIQIVCQGFVR